MTLTTTAIIAAAWIACSVAAYLLLRHAHRKEFGIWVRSDRWFFSTLSMLGPMSLLAVILAISTIVDSERGNDVLWRKDDC